jgi:O-antigen ligase
MNELASLSDADAARSAGRRMVEWGALACLLASPLVAPVLLGGSRLWVSGPLMALVFLAALLVMLRALLWREADMALRVPPGALAWTGFVLYSAIAIFAYDTPYEARVELLRVASLWLGYWAWSNLGGVGGRWRWVLGVVLLAASANALYGLFNYIQGHPTRVLWFDRALEGAVGYVDRISGTYFCPNHWASLLAMLAPVALALVLLSEAGATLRILAGYALLTFLPAVHVSQSRAGWIGLAAGLMVTTLALVWRRSRVWFAVLLVVLPLVVAGGALLYWKQSPAFRARFTEAIVEGKTGDGFRVNQWRDSLVMFAERPVFGHGPGSYGWVAEATRRHMKDPKHQAFYAHNDYLHSLVDFGLVGTLLLALPLGWLGWRLWRTLRRVREQTEVALVAGLLGAWTAMLVHAAFDFNLRIYANVAVLALLSGLVAGRLIALGVWSPRPAPRWLAGVGAAVAALLLGVMSWMLVSYYLNIRAGWAIDALNYKQAEHLARQAVRWDAGNWYAAEALGQVLQIRGRWGQNERERRADAEGAERAFALAAHGNRLNMETRFEHGLALMALERPEEALPLFRQAADTNPINVTFRAQYGLQLRLAGRYAEALAEFRKAAAVAMDPMIQANLKWLEQKLAGGK